MINEIISLLKSLIEFQSTQSKPDEILKCADFIEDYLKSIPIQYQRIEQNSTPSLLVLPGTQRAPVLLMSHFDVVDGSEELFRPVEKNGAVFGRGALDDKYAVAISLVLLKEHMTKLKEAGLTQDDLPFGVLLTGDEESGGMDGANFVLPSLNTEFCIALDGGALDEIVTKEKGILSAKLVFRGKSSHGARPWLGTNAIDGFIEDYQIVKSFFDLETQDNWHRTLNLSRVNAGKSINQVPDLAEAVFDIRFTENDDIESLINEIQQKISGEFFVLRKDPLFLAKKSRQLDIITGANPDIKTVSEHGSSDARFLSAYGINGIVWGANGNLSHHSVDEHVEIESISELYLRLDAFIRENTNFG